MLIFDKVSTLNNSEFPRERIGILVSLISFIMGIGIYIISEKAENKVFFKIIAAGDFILWRCIFLGAALGILQGYFFQSEIVGINITVKMQSIFIRMGYGAVLGSIIAPISIYLALARTEYRIDNELRE